MVNSRVNRRLKGEQEQRDSMKCPKEVILFPFLSIQYIVVGYKDGLVGSNGGLV